MFARALDVLTRLSSSLEGAELDETTTKFSLGLAGGRPSLDNQSVTLRGHRSGRPVSLTYSSYYPMSFDPLATRPYDRAILEIFVAAPTLRFEGTCRRARLRDELSEQLRLGGLRGSHRVFETCRVDAAPDVDRSDFDRPAFADLLEALVRRRDCAQVVLEAGRGILVLLRWDDRFALQHVTTVLDEVVKLAATLDA